jgi:glucokinase
MILAGDIGGTKTNVALFETSGRAIGPVVRQQTFPSAHYNSLEGILTEFIGETQLRLTGACFGIAAPVIEGNARTPNLNWTVNSQLLTLNAGDERHEGHRALLAAGTGLGMAGIFFRDGHYHPIASEGGHIDFAPRTPDEIELLNYLMEKFAGHVSYERVLSGPGLFNVYCFLRDRGYAEEPAWLADKIQAGDKTAAVSMAALGNKSPLAVKALDMFAAIYGAMAGNLALLMMSTGGLYVGGGIAPKLREKLKDGTFIKAFTDKGRFSAVLARIPVHIILEDKTALFGAAHATLNGRS